MLGLLTVLILFVAITVTVTGIRASRYDVTAEQRHVHDVRDLRHDTTTGDHWTLRPSRVRHSHQSVSTRMWNYVQLSSIHRISSLWIAECSTRLLTVVTGLVAAFVAVIVYLIIVAVVTLLCCLYKRSTSSVVLSSFLVCVSFNRKNEKAVLSQTTARCSVFLPIPTLRLLFTYLFTLTA